MDEKNEMKSQEKFGKTEVINQTEASWEAAVYKREDDKSPYAKVRVNSISNLFADFSEKMPTLKQ